MGKKISMVTMIEDELGTILDCLVAGKNALMREAIKNKWTYSFGGVQEMRKDVGVVSELP